MNTHYLLILFMDSTSFMVKPFLQNEPILERIHGLINLQFRSRAGRAKFSVGWTLSTRINVDEVPDTSVAKLICQVVCNHGTKALKKTP